jgi:hypothetical protein
MKSLALTPFESYLFHDDRPAHPCWQVARYRWRGRFQRDALEVAWAEAARRNPLLGAAVRRGPLGGLRWELREGTVPSVHWSRREAGREWPDWQPLDLERGTGVRLYVVEEDGSADTILCAHHAVCDGLGMEQVLEDLFLLYARGLGEPIEPRPAASEAALRKRGRFGANPLDGLRIAVLQVLAIAAEAKLLRRAVAPLIPHVPAPSSAPRAADWPAVASRRWSPAETVAIQKAARSAGTSVAVLCMRDLQAAIGAWRLAQGVDLPQDWIRLGAAVSLRHRIRGTRPVANIFGMAAIDRQARSLANRGRLLRRAREDMALIDRWSLGYVFWMLLAVRRWLPGGIRAYARRPVARLTFVMSYMGKVFSKHPLRREGGYPAVPGAVIEDIQGIGPTRPGTCACIDLTIAFGRFAADLNYDPRVLSRAQATALVDEFARQLALSVAGA